MATIIGLCNRKGGVTKTYSTISIATCLAIKGKRVLIADADTQCHVEYHLLGGDEQYYDGTEYLEENLKTVYDVIENGLPLRDAVIPLHYSKRILDIGRLGTIECDLDLLPGSKKLDEIPADEEHSNFIPHLFDDVRDDYDYIIMDFPPSLSDAMILFFAACDRILVPAEPGMETDISGYIQVLDAIQIVRDAGLNPSIEPLGMFFSKVMEYKSDQKQAYEDQMKDKDDWMLFENYVRFNYGPVRKAISAHVPINIFNRNAPAARDYMDLTDEILEKLGDRA